MVVYQIQKFLFVDNFEESSRKRLGKSDKELVDDEPKPEALNARALAVINRVSNKLTGSLDVLIFNLRPRF